MLMTSSISMGVLIILLIAYVWGYSRGMRFGKYNYSRKYYIIFTFCMILLYKVVLSYMMPDVERVSGLVQYETYKVVSYKTVDNYIDSYIKVVTKKGVYKLPISRNYNKFNQIDVNYISVPRGKGYRTKLNKETKEGYTKHLRIVAYANYVKLSNTKYGVPKSKYIR